MKTIAHPFDRTVVAETHPSVYLMHKYWARKPHNVVARYIEYYTEPGDVVLDPFMGSGVTLIEAVKLRRYPIGNDLNPLACFITNTTLLPVDLVRMHHAYERIKATVKDRIYSYYKVSCSSCGEDADIAAAIWKRDKLRGESIAKLRVKCPHCEHTEFRDSTRDDLRRYRNIETKPIGLYYPKNVPLHKTAKRSVEYIHELFVHRALLCLSILLSEIRRERDGVLRDAFLFCFTSNLAQMSKLNSIDMRAGREYSSRG